MRKHRRKHQFRKTYSLSVRGHLKLERLAEDFDLPKSACLEFMVEFTAAQRGIFVTDEEVEAYKNKVRALQPSRRSLREVESVEKYRAAMDYMEEAFG
jgi:DNA-binding PadR family transcriptional regulator